MADNPAVDEYNKLVSSANKSGSGRTHPEDRFQSSTLQLSDSDNDEQNERKQRSRPARIQAQSRSRSRSAAAGSSRPGVNYILPTNKRGIVTGNTGVKGVISDAIAFDNARQQQRDMRRNESGLAGLSTQPEAGQEADALMRGKGRQAHEPETYDGNSDSDVDVDEDFIKEWMHNRVNQVVSYPTHAVPSSRRNLGLMAVDADTYLTIVDSSPPHLTVVVLIHNPDSETSLDVAEALDQVALSSTSSKVRFIMLGHDEAEMNEEGVPAILTYREGEMVDSLIRVQDMLNLQKPGSLAIKLTALLKS